MKNFINRYFIAIILFYIFMGIIIFWYINNESNILPVLNGDAQIESEIYIDYEDPGFSLKSGKNVIDSKRYNYSVISDVNTNHLGSYDYSYVINYHFKKYTLSRKVTIVDKTKPEITIDTDVINKDFCTKKVTTNYNVTAVDNYDGDISDKVIVHERDDSLYIEVADSSGNNAVKVIDYNYSNLPSYNIKLNGEINTYLGLGTEYVEPGFNFMDNCGNKIDSPIKVLGEVDSSKAGTYTLTYYTKYKNKNYQVTRNVIVRSIEEMPGYNKNVYLTFDDGPGKYTEELLSILDKYQVKVTFFVTNQFPDYQNMILLEHQKGHVIGVHSFSHKWSIYSNMDSYIADFNAMNDIIENYTGTRSQIFRFPGGSSNTVSKKYSSGIVTKLAEKMQSDGYVYFDWNVDSGDAAGKSPEAIYTNVIDGISRFNNSIVLLHDIQPNTIKTIENILVYGIENGYSFKTLSTSSYVSHHGIRN